MLKKIIIYSISAVFIVGCKTSSLTEFYSTSAKDLADCELICKNKSPNPPPASNFDPATKMCSCQR